MIAFKGTLPDFAIWIDRTPNGTPVFPSHHRSHALITIVHDRYTNRSEPFEQLCRRVEGFVVESRHPYTKVTSEEIHEFVLTERERQGERA